MLGDFIDNPNSLVIYDTIQPLAPTLSQITGTVATSQTRIWLNVWNQPKIPVTLQQVHTFN